MGSHAKVRETRQLRAPVCSFERQHYPCIYHYTCMNRKTLVCCNEPIGLHCVYTHAAASCRRTPLLPRQHSGRARNAIVAHIWLHVLVITLLRVESFIWTAFLALAQLTGTEEAPQEASKAATMPPKVKRIMTQPIVSCKALHAFIHACTHIIRLTQRAHGLCALLQNLIFRFLQSRQKVQIWLFEQTDLRVEGRIIVSPCLKPHMTSDIP